MSVDDKIAAFHESAVKMDAFVSGWQQGYQQGRRDQFWKMVLITLPLLAGVVLLLMGVR